MNVVLTRGKGDGNPYVGPGLAGVPAVLLRSMPTPELLALAIREAMILRKMSAHDIARVSGVPFRDVQRLSNTGVGTLKTANSVLSALSIKPVALPPLSSFKAAD